MFVTKPSHLTSYMPTTGELQCYSAWSWLQGRQRRPAAGGGGAAAAAEPGGGGGRAAQAARALQHAALVQGAGRVAGGHPHPRAPAQPPRCPCFLPSSLYTRPLLILAHRSMGAGGALLRTCCPRCSHLKKLACGCWCRAQGGGAAGGQAAGGAATLAGAAALPCRPTEWRRIAPPAAHRL